MPRRCHRLPSALLAALLAAPAWGGSDPLHAVPTSPACGFIDGFESDALPRPAVVVVTSGGYRLIIDRDHVQIRDPLDRNVVQHFGNTHESLNGLHLKDWGGAAGWDGARRTVELGDGSKVTMQSHAVRGQVVATSIYDGARNVQVANCRNAVVHESRDALDTAEREQTQYDGEITTFTTQAGSGMATYETRGNENAAFQFLATPRLLGNTGGFAHPTLVNDFFDDPRHGHT